MSEINPDIRRAWNVQDTVYYTQTIYSRVT